MAEIKRTYNIPLRSWFSKKPKYTRAKVAIRAIKDFLKKHMKSDDVKLGPKLNLEIWKNGIKNPPHHIKVDVIKNNDGEVTAELFGHKYESQKKVEKKESIKDRLMNKVGGSQKTIVKKVKEDEAPAGKKEVKIKKPEVKTETTAKAPVEKEQVSKEEKK